MLQSLPISASLDTCALGPPGAMSVPLSPLLHVCSVRLCTAGEATNVSPPAWLHHTVTILNGMAAAPTRGCPEVVLSIAPGILDHHDRCCTLHRCTAEAPNRGLTWTARRCRMQQKIWEFVPSYCEHAHAVDALWLTWRDPTLACLGILQPRIRPNTARQWLGGVGAEEALWESIKACKTWCRYSGAFATDWESACHGLPDIRCLVCAPESTGRACRTMTRHCR